MIQEGQTSTYSPKVIICAKGKPTLPTKLLFYRLLSDYHIVFFSLN